ncbi:MAG TPA: class D sortase [Acidobacteriaceae bacterium]|jgi:sortase A|nr:class D sortase [Acidobacteriaceae bacterium]
MFDRRKLTHDSPVSPGATPRARHFVRAWIEIALLVIGVVLLAVFGAAQVDRYLTARDLLNAFPAAGSAARADVTPEDPTIETAGGAVADATGSPLAVLHIPGIHLDVPVLDGTDVLTLNHAAGRIAGTALPGEAGNIGIAAHRDGFFRNLGKVRIGDPIELETRDGVATYVVEQTQVVMPNDVSVLDPRAAPALTLVTCYPFHYLGRAPQRYIVTALLDPTAHASSAANRAAQTHPRAE